MDDKKYWIGFNLIKGIGAVRMQGLVAYFGDLESAWNANAAELMEAGLGAKLAELATVSALPTPPPTKLTLAKELAVVEPPMSIVVAAGATIAVLGSATEAGDP